MSNGIVKEDYQEGVWESEYKCKKCRRNAVVGYKPYRDNPWLIWYDCMYCGAELGDGEEPNSHIPNWYDPREKQKELTEKKRTKKQYYSIKWELYHPLFQEMCDSCEELIEECVVLTTKQKQVLQFCPKCWDKIKDEYEFITKKSGEEK